LKASRKLAQLLGTIMLATGAGFIGEHYVSYGYVDWFDFIGHETYGLIALIIGICFITLPTQFWKRWVKD